MAQVTYLGVAGLLPEHIKPVGEYYATLVKGMHNPPVLFFGLQTSRKHLLGEQINPVYAGRMNSLTQINDAVSEMRDIARCEIIVHYNPSGGYNLPGVRDQVSEIKRIEGVAGIQWNGFSTSKRHARANMIPFHNMESYGFSILQIGRIDFLKHNVFAHKICDSVFQKPNTHLLFDNSGGKGTEIDVAKVSKWLKALRASHNKLGLAISGGFSPYNVVRIVRQIQEQAGIFNWNISIDAEGKLFTDGKFDNHKAIQFLGAALQFYK